MLPLFIALLLTAPPAPEHLLVHEGGLAFLTPDGLEAEKLGPDFTNGSLSPDGRFLACFEYKRDLEQSQLTLRPRDGKSPAVHVPEVSVGAEAVCLLVWSPDGTRLLVGEDRSPMRGKRIYRFRVCDVRSKKLAELKLPEGHWPTGWSKDGKRLLSSLYEGAASRIAWVNADGSGEPEFLSPEDEIAVHPRLSPTGGKVLYKTLPGIDEDGGKPQLYVLDLTTKKRQVVNDPGEVNGYCWSPDGTRLAYTWQRSLKKREEAPERETLLITCDADGKDRKTLARRKFKPVSPRAAVAVFFEVVDWR